MKWTWTYPRDAYWPDTPRLFMGTEEEGRCTVVVRTPWRWVVVCVPRWLHHCIPAADLARERRQRALAEDTCRMAMPGERDLTGHTYDCPNHPGPGWPHEETR